MTIATQQPLGSYITERELPRTTDGRVFELLLPYQLEESEKATVFRWRWTYTDAQRAIDASNGLTSGRRARHTLEKQAFIRQVQRELREEARNCTPSTGRKFLCAERPLENIPAGLRQIGARPETAPVEFNCSVLSGERSLRRRSGSSRLRDQHTGWLLCARKFPDGAQGHASGH